MVKVKFLTTRINAGLLTIAVGTILTTTVGGAGLAHADTPTMTGGAVEAYTSGSTTQTSRITWQWKYGATFTLLVADTKADGVHATGRVQSESPSGAVTSYSWHSAVGAGAEYENSTYVKNSSGVWAMRVESCRVGAALPTICSYSTWARNGFY